MKPLTREELLSRGYCCKLGCVNCPYDDMTELQELLTITMEDCGELIQACSKAIRCDEYYDNDKLKEEIGDVQCMIDLIHKYDLVSHREIDNQVNVKKMKLMKYSKLL